MVVVVVVVVVVMVVVVGYDRMRTELNDEAVETKSIRI